MPVCKPIEGLTLEYLKSVLSYNPVTGQWRWLKVHHGTKSKDGLAGGVNSEGYRVINICGRLCKAHILAWFYMTGTWPTKMLDHSNRIKSDNRWSNLRLATDSQNKANSDTYKCNKSGYPGVVWYSRDSIWEVNIRVNKKLIYLGRFESKEAAIAARHAAEKRLFREYAPR